MLLRVVVETEKEMFHSRHSRILRGSSDHFLASANLFKNHWGSWRITRSSGQDSGQRPETRNRLPTVSDLIRSHEPMGDKSSSQLD